MSMSRAGERLSRIAPQIDIGSVAVVDTRFNALAASITAGAARFWRKRGGDPEAGNWLAKSKRNLAHKRRRTALAALTDGETTPEQILSECL